jgi:ubiquinone/menaquinone biosynthesis C-methylase UbiE
VSTDLNPQAQQMADESMVRNLAAQARAIWPQELPLFERYVRGGLPSSPRLLDAGCGTGEITGRLAELFPGATVLGVDVEERHLASARARLGAFASRVSFERRSVFDLELPPGSFDLVVCRHVVQAIPHADRVLAELRRVLRPGGWLHLLAEDYGMVWMQPRSLDPKRFWRETPDGISERTGADAFVGRRAFGLLRALRFEEVRVDYVVVDTLRVERETFAAIWTAWRDGYSGYVAEQTGRSPEEIRANFEDQIATIRDPDAYACWMVPIVSGRAPA